MVERSRLAMGAAAALLCMSPSSLARSIHTTSRRWRGGLNGVAAFHNAVAPRAAGGGRPGCRRPRCASPSAQPLSSLRRPWPGTVSRMASTDAAVSAEAAALGERIAAKGEEVRALKAAGADKTAVTAAVSELMALKTEYQKITGGAFGPPPDPAKEAAKAEREALKVAQLAEKEAKKAAKLAEQRAQSASVLASLGRVNYGAAGEALPSQVCGDYETIASRAESGRVFSRIPELDSAAAGAVVWVRGRIQNSRGSGSSAFLVLRGPGGATVQAVAFKSKASDGDGDSGGADANAGALLLKYLASLPLETVVDVQGELVAADVRSCTQSDVEIKVARAHAVSRAEAMLPFLPEDAGRSEEVVEASQGTDRPFPRLGQEIRLDNRWLDLRAPAQNAVMRVQSAVCQLFREALYEEGFVEIHTPKLIPGESEGGSDVFRTDYFGSQACLAQSPQLYKQMAISADLPRVFEVGPVFRAEKSNTRRHLCEFTGLDIEMAVGEHYLEVLRVLHKVFCRIFAGLEGRHATELAAIRRQFPSSAPAITAEPCVIHWEEALKWLREAGESPGELDDLTGAQELVLGAIVKEKFGTDFFALDRYPTAVRPFYTMPCPDDGRFSNSYDLFLRGQEICSGAQRCHDPDMLTAAITAKGVPLAPLKDYVAAFRHGCPPHGGAGIGLERVVFLYLGLDNVRKASMFPRDPNRCSP